MSDFVLNRAVLSEDEKQEILTALQSINTAKNIQNSQTLQKLSGMFQLNSENWLEIDFSRLFKIVYHLLDKGQATASELAEKFELLKSAIFQCKTVKIQYANSNKVLSERIIQPLKLVYKSMAWYLKAFCTEKQDWRVFKLNRIIDLTLLNEHFQRREFPESTDSPEEEYHQITLRFPKEMAYRVYDEFDKTQVQQQANGDFIASAAMPQDSWLIGFLLSFGTQVEIISPAYLREVVAEQAKLIYEKYKP